MLTLGAELAQQPTPVAPTGFDFAGATAFLRRRGAELEEFAVEIRCGKDKAVFSGAKVCAPAVILNLWPKAATKSLLFPSLDPRFRHISATFAKRVH